MTTSATGCALLYQCVKSRQHLSDVFARLYSLVCTSLPKVCPCTLFFSMSKLSKLLCRCLCTSQRLPPPSGGVRSTCSSNASPSSVSSLQPASTMVQSGPTGDGGCLWDWLLSQLLSWGLVPCSCQTPPTPLSSVARLRKDARCWRVTEVSSGYCLHCTLCSLYVLVCMCVCLHTVCACLSGQRGYCHTQHCACCNCTFLFACIHLSGHMIERRCHCHYSCCHALQYAVAPGALLHISWHQLCFERCLRMLLIFARYHPR